MQENKQIRFRNMLRGNKVGKMRKRGYRIGAYFKMQGSVKGMYLRAPREIREWSCSKIRRQKKSLGPF
jgi:hypothetical protein